MIQNLQIQNDRVNLTAAEISEWNTWECHNSMTQPIPGTKPSEQKQQENDDRTISSLFLKQTKQSATTYTSHFVYCRELVPGTITGFVATAVHITLSIYEMDSTNILRHKIPTPSDMEQ